MGAALYAQWANALALRRPRLACSRTRIRRIIDRNANTLAAFSGGIHDRGGKPRRDKCLPGTLLPGIPLPDTRLAGNPSVICPAAIDAAVADRWIANVGATATLGTPVKARAASSRDACDISILVRNGHYRKCFGFKGNHSGSEGSEGAHDAECLVQGSFLPNKPPQQKVSLRLAGFNRNVTASAGDRDPAERPEFCARETMLKATASASIASMAAASARRQPGLGSAKNRPSWA
jgi:hypothetical protein